MNYAEAVQRVLEVHKPVEEHPDRPEYLWCGECKDQTYPCRTVQALTNEG